MCLLYLGTFHMCLLYHGTFHMCSLYHGIFHIYVCSIMEHCINVFVPSWNITYICSFHHWTLHAYVCSNVEHYIYVFVPSWHIAYIYIYIYIYMCVCVCVCLCLCVCLIDRGNTEKELGVHELLWKQELYFYCSWIFKNMPRWDRCITVLGDCAESANILEQ